MTSAATTILERPHPTCGPVHRFVSADRDEEVEPDYVLRRTVAGFLLVAAVAVTYLLGNSLASLGGDPAAAAETRPAIGAPPQHVAVAGDTMWSIAHEHRGDVDHGRYVAALIRLNGGTDVQIGQAIQLP